MQQSKTKTVLTLKSLQEEIVTKTGTPIFQTNQSGIAFDPIRNRVFISTRWSAESGWYQTEPNSEIVGDFNRLTYSPTVDWEMNMSVRGRNLYLKDSTLRASTAWSRIAIKNLDTEIENNVGTYEYQYFDKTNRDTGNRAMIVDDNQDIWVGEDLSGQSILRKVVPVTNPSPTNLMTIPGDYIELQVRVFSQLRGSVVDIIGTRALTWYNGSVWGIDANNNLLVELTVEDIAGSNNKRAVISDNIIELPSDITYIGDIARGSNCWYIAGSDGSQRMTGSQMRDIFWIWTVLD